jgi:hypothetical protein
MCAVIIHHYLLFFSADNVGPSVFDKILQTSCDDIEIYGFGAPVLPKGG